MNQSADLVIETLAASEADLIDAVCRRTAERDWYREVSQCAIQVLREEQVQNQRLRTALRQRHPEWEQEAS